MSVSVGEIAGFIAAVAFAVLVWRLGGVINKAGAVLDEASAAVRKVSDETLPLITEMTNTVTATNGQIERLDAITANLATMSNNLNALTSLTVATVGRPMLKVASVGYGIKQAMSGKTSGSVTRQR